MALCASFIYSAIHSLKKYLLSFHYVASCSKGCLLFPLCWTHHNIVCLLYFFFGLKGGYDLHGLLLAHVPQLSSQFTNPPILL